jgi:DNA polymerase-3 subunit delta
MPPISAEVLVERLAKGKPVPAVLLLGPESYLREACRERIVELVVEPASRDWAVARFSARDDELTRSLGQAQTVPMLAPRQVVMLTELEAVEEQGEAKREAAIGELTAYLNDPAPFTVLILEASGLDKRMRLAKLLAEKVLVVVAELPDDPEERAAIAAKLAVQMARERKAVLEPGAAEDLADLCNADLSAIRNEIEKLATYAGPGQTIRRLDVEALVVSEKKYSVWELADMLATRQRARALAFLDSLLREGEQMPAVVGAMAWMYRKLLEAQELGPRVSGGQAAGRLGMRTAAAEMAVRQAQKISRGQLVDGLRALYDADSRLKSGSADDRAVMEFLVARLIGRGPAAKAR